MNEKQDFEWLTEEICREFKERADKLSECEGDTGAWRSLRIELQERCHITEVQAYNILRGYNVRDYLNYYDILSGRVPEPQKMKDKREKDQKKKSMEDKMKEYEEKIAALESLRHSRLSDFDFEERD